MRRIPNMLTGTSARLLALVGFVAFVIAPVVRQDRTSEENNPEESPTKGATHLDLSPRWNACYDPSTFEVVKKTQPVETVFFPDKAGGKSLEYRRRDPEDSVLYQIMAEHLETFLARTKQDGRTVLGPGIRRGP